MMDEIKIAKYLSGELEGDELNEVEGWLKLPENKNEFDKISQLWEESHHLKDVELFNTDKNWSSMQEKMHKLQHKSGGARNLTLLRYAIAASFVLLLGLAAVFYFQASNTRKGIQYVANAEMINKPVKLPDGSTVYLNRNTNLTVDKNFNENTRTVTLSGEAFFDVAKNQDKPFIIKTAGAEIKVVGTSFNVMAYNTSDSIQVSVESGIVELYPKTDKDSKIRLTVGKEGTYVKSNRKLLSREHFDMNMLAWRTGKLNFRNADMNYVVSALEHAFGKSIVLEDSKFKNCRLTVNFNNQSLETILKVIQETITIKITNEGDVYKLSGPGC